MRKDYLEDLFLHKQPTCDFEELNTPVYSSRPENWNKRFPEKDEVAVSGVVFDFCFTDFLKPHILTSVILCIFIARRKASIQYELSLKMGCNTKSIA